MNKYVISILIGMILVTGSLIAQPLWAQTSTLPAELEIRPTLCPCEVVLLNAPNGVSSVTAEFTDNKAMVVIGPSLIGAGGSADPPSTEWIFTPGMNTTSSRVTKHETWRVSYTDTLNEINPGDTEVLLLTMTIPVTAEITKIMVKDNDRNTVLRWP